MIRLFTALVLSGALQACTQMEFQLEPDASRDAGLIDAANGFPNLVFVTSESIIPILTSAADADRLCNRLAGQAGLPGTYSAWYARDRTAYDALVGSRGWVRVDGTSLVDTLEDLRSGATFRPVQFDELGNTVTGDINIATASDATGDPALELSGNCNQFQDTAGSLNIGRANLSGDAMFIGRTKPCDRSARVYCFGFGASVVVIR